MPDLSGWTNLETGGDAGFCSGGTMGVGVSGSLSCTDNIYSVELSVTGGTPPFVWTISEGEIVVTNTRSARLHIHTAVEGTFLNFTGWPTNSFPLGQPCNAQMIDNASQPGVPGDPGYDAMGNYLTDPTGATWASSAIGFSPAFMRLGKEMLDKGGFSECRHHCTAFYYDCYGRPFMQGNILISDNVFLPNSVECPYIALDPSSNPYPYGNGNPIGACLDTRLVDWTFPPTYPLCTYVDYPTDPTLIDPECYLGLPCADPVTGILFGYQDGSWHDYYSTYGGPLQDVRHPNLKALGCSPCSVIQGTDIIVTVTDYEGQNAIAIIHVY